LEANRPINYCENEKGERFPMFENNPFRQEANEQAIQAGKQAIAELESQEPLEYWNAVEGWVKIDEVREHFDSVGCGTIYKTAGEDRVPVYTTPTQRTWVDLTNDEIALIHADNPHPQGFARAVLAKSKEKNT
jgi:hypothetical protein